MADSIAAKATQSQTNGVTDVTANGDSPASRTSRTNPFAIAALVCGIVQFGLPAACFAAIILGHMARRQIRRTGEGGSGIAAAGLILGYFLLVSSVLVLLIGLLQSAPASS